MASRMKIRKDDQVKVISGKDRGKTGTVLRTDPERQRVYVQGANIQKRHQKPQQLQDTQRTSQIEGGVIEVEGPIHVSNVQLLDPSTGDPTRVTLRDARMYEFLDRLISIAIPRIRDFRGLNARSFDGRGNWSMGVREQIIFPEIDYDGIDQVRGLDITITTTATTDEEAFALLHEFGMPFRADGRPGEQPATDEDGD